MILCARACKQGIYVWMGYGAVEDLNFIFIFIFISTQNSSDIDLVKDIVSANKVTICFHCISFFTN